MSTSVVIERQPEFSNNDSRWTAKKILSQDDLKISESLQQDNQEIEYLTAEQSDGDDHGNNDIEFEKICHFKSDFPRNSQTSADNQHESTKPLLTPSCKQKFKSNNNSKSHKLKYKSFDNKKPSKFVNNSNSTKGTKITDFTINSKLPNNTYNNVKIGTKEANCSISSQKYVDNRQVNNNCSKESHDIGSGSCLKDRTKSLPNCANVHVQFSTKKTEKIVPTDEPFSKLWTKIPEMTKNNIFPSLNKGKRLRKPLGESQNSVASKSSVTTNDFKTEFERRPLDGGYGWIVVFSAFMVHFFADGVTMSFGLIYIEFLGYFGESKSVTSWVGSLFMAIPLLAGPLASYATDLYGCRAVTIWGAVISCLGFLLSAYANSIIVLFFTLGIIAGLGLAVCYVAAIVIVAFYFEKLRSLATGIAVAGSGIGTFVFAPIIQYLLENYGWRGCLILLAGTFLNMAVCGALMRDLKWSRKKSSKSNHHNSSSSVPPDITLSSEGSLVNHSTDSLDNYCDDHARPSSTIPSLEELVQSGDIASLLSSEEAVPANLLRSGSMVLLPTYLDKSEVLPNEFLPYMSLKTNAYELFSNLYPHLLSCDSLTRSASQADFVKSVHIGNQTMKSTVHDKYNLNYQEFYEEIPKKKELNFLIEVPSSGHLQLSKENLNQMHRTLSASRSETPVSAFISRRNRRQSMTYRGAILDIHRYRLRSSSCPNISRTTKKVISKRENKDDIREIISSCADMSYFTDRSYVIFAMSNFILYVFYDTVYMYLTDYAQEIGIPPDDSANLISSIGILNCVGMIIMGYMGDKVWCSPLLIYNASMVACGLSVIVMPFVVNYWLLTSVSAIFGFFISANYALTAVILVELISLEAFSKSYGMLLLIQGIANLIGPPLVGFMADATGSYTIPFVVSGIFIVICGLLLSFIPILNQWEKPKKNSSEPV